MIYDKQIQLINIDDRDWWKISGDQAFESILEGYSSYEYVWQKLVKNQKVVVQAGGYCGVFPRLLSQVFDSVYTFEPDPLNFYCLTRNCQTDNVIKTQGALGNTYGLLSVVRTNTHNRGMNVMRQTETSSIPTYRIDDLGLTACDLIALDTEGFEYEVLKGASATIDWYKPVITVEDPTNEIDEFLGVRGYKIQALIHGRDAIYSV
jgi:FkbM family methyltransferase